MPFIALFLLYCAFALTAGGLLVEYVFEFWATFATHKPVDIPFFAAMLAAIPLSGVALPAAAVTFMFSFFL